MSRREEFESTGFIIARGLFSEQETASLRDHMMEVRKDERPGDFSGVDLTSNDPLKKYPRMIHMHRWDEASLRWMIDERLNEWMTELTGGSPIAVQTMLYFKPPGARGQALHQDNYYLKAQPGTCIAAWMALDDCDEENGCMMVVPGSQDLPMLCTIQADTTQSFTDVTVPIPPGMAAVPVRMKAGDVLFFNGSLIHGSYPNVSDTRFRRAMIGHYITAEASKVSEFYHPCLRMDGTGVVREIAEGGGSCGQFVDRDGEKVLEMVAATHSGPAHE
jgi:ectoine hydroxylase-related dioxygenase (phytanoyl-CoA dioxygenase family)